MALDRSVEETVTLPYSIEAINMELTRILNDHGNMINQIIAYLLAEVNDNRMVQNLVGFTSTVATKTLTGEEVVATTAAITGGTGHRAIIFAKAGNATTAATRFDLRKGTTIAGTFMDTAQGIPQFAPGVCFAFDTSPAAGQQYVLTNYGNNGDSMFGFSGIVVELGPRVDFTT